MSFSAFVRSETGEAIRPIILSLQAVQRMEAISEAGRPALLAIDTDIRRAVPRLTVTEKQHVGRWVHRVLGPRGWRPVEKKRMPAGSLFTTAAVFERVGPSGAVEQAAPGDGRSELAARSERLTALRARVERLPVKPLSVRQFLAEKRAAAKREG